MGAGMIKRRVRPQSVADISLAIEMPGAHPMLILTVPAGATTALARWPASTGVETTFQTTPDGRVDVCLKLVNPAAGDLFETLVDDIVDKVAVSTTSAASLRTFVGRFAAWQRFLETGAAGLGPLAQLGLYGELWFLHHQLMEWLDGDAAISAWKGPLGANQDFQTSGVGIEVKCTSTKLPLRVHIQSERQLDGVGMDKLYLFVLTFDVRDGKDRTLPEMVAAIRSRIGFDSAACQMLDERLIGLGYRDVDEQHYNNRSYTLRTERFFGVTEGFPRLVEADIPVGIADLSYSVLVDSCDAFHATADELREAVASEAGG